MIPLSSLMTLKTTAVFSEFKKPVVLPVPYGRVTYEPVQEDNNGVSFILSARQINSVISVFRDNAEITAFEFVFEISDDGNYYPKIKLRNALSDSEKLEVEVFGIADKNGGLLTNPAKIIDDIFVNILGLDSQKNRLSEYEAECKNASIELNGLLSDNNATVRAVIDEIVISSGAVWSGSMRDFAKIYPVTSRPQHVPISANITPFNLSSKTDSRSLFTVVKLNYDFNQSTGEPRAAISARSKQGVSDFGVLSIDVDAKWLSNNTQAIALIENLVRYYARLKYELSFNALSDFDNVRIGDYITVTHKNIPSLTDKNEVFVTSHVVNDASIDLVCEFIAGNVPDVEIITVSKAFTPQSPQGLLIEFDPDTGLLVITVKNVSESPIAGAEVTLDGDVTRTTNSDGRASFSGVETGAHVMHFEASGFVPQDFGFTL